MNDEMRMGQYCVLRRSNIDKVMEITHWDREELEQILERHEAVGIDKVKLPLVPRHLLESGS